MRVVRVVQRVIMQSKGIQGCLMGIVIFLLTANMGFGDGLGNFEGNVDKKWYVTEGHPLGWRPKYITKEMDIDAINEVLYYLVQDHFHGKGRHIACGCNGELLNFFRYWYEQALKGEGIGKDILTKED